MTDPLPSWVNPTIAIATREDFAVAEATRFCNEFKPEPGVDYGWVLARAKEQYALAETTFKALDDKASSIVTYLGSGTGALALAWTAAVTSNNVLPGVGACAFPAFCAAFWAVKKAMYARSPRGCAYPPSGKEAARRADYYHDAAAKEAEYSTVGQWHYAAAVMQWAADKKADAVNEAALYLTWAVGLLSLPLVASVVARFLDPAKAPPTFSLSVNF